jgi:hypothetical protein
MSGRRQRPEAAIQRAVFAHLRARGAPGVFAFHPANGGWRSPIEGAIFRGLGVVPGTPDVIVIHQGRCYALELKAEGGRATPKQLEVIAAMEAAGAITRAWWRIEARRLGSDWPGILRLQAEAVFSWRARHDPQTRDAA